MQNRTSTSSATGLATDSTTNLPTFVMTTSPISPSDGQEQDCYFTAKAVPIRASMAGPAALSSLNSSPSPFSPDSPHHSTLITPSQFPPPPGHSYPSFVFRKPPTPLVAEIVDSRASSQYAPPASTGVEGRESVLSATPSLFPQPPSANGKEADIRPLFSRGRQSTLSAMSLPGPTPPPKEYRPTISPMTNDYFSPLAPASTSVQPPPAPPVPPREPQPAAAAEFGISRITKPLPLELVGSNTALMAQHSPISPHSPVPNPAMTPLTIQTLTHLSNTALRSPSLTFVEAGLSSPRPSYAGSASPLTSAQRDRLWEMKKKYDERKGRRYDDGDEKGRWGMTRTGGGRGEEGGRGSMRTYLLVGLALGILACGGIVGLVVALALAQGGGS
ncbi:hypothetical protein SUNI508_09590 [Seiridium unicorne]|uniref:Uncharacterized protein n=1 Tax=Seiridium unicorne TaxID=138068 RepID=A0ABR2UPT8_9PEZI